MTSATIDLTAEMILDEIAERMSAPTGTGLVVGDDTYIVLRGAGALETMLGGKSAGNAYGKENAADKLILALEATDGPCAVFLPTKDNGTDDDGFRSVSTQNGAFVTRAGRLALAGKIKTSAKKGLKYTAELRPAPADLVAKLPAAPKPAELVAARALIKTYAGEGDGRNIESDFLLTQAQDDELGNPGSVEAIKTAIAVRDAHNAQARLKLIQGAIGARWY